MFGEIAKCLRSRTQSDADPTVLAIMPSVERIVMNDDLHSTLSRDVSSASGRSSRLSRDILEDKENARPIESMSMKELQAKVEKDQLEDDEEADTKSLESLSIKTEESASGSGSVSHTLSEQELLVSLEELRRMMRSPDRIVTLDRLVEAGLIRVLVACLSTDCDERRESQMNAAQALSTIATNGDENHLRSFMGAGGFVAMLTALDASENVTLVEELLFGLITILKLHRECIEYCVSHGLVKSLAAVLQKPCLPTRVLQMVLNLLSLVGAPKGTVPICEVLPLFSVLMQKQDITADAAKTLYYMALAERRAQKNIGLSIADSQGLLMLSSLLYHSSQRARFAALLIVEDTMNADADTIPVLLEAGIAERLHSFLGHQRPDVVKLALRVLKTLTNYRLEEILQHDLLLAVSELFAVYDSEMQKMVIDCVRTVLAKGDAVQKCRMTVPLCNMIGPFASEVLMILLSELHGLLGSCVAEEFDKIRTLTMGTGILDKLERLQCHQDVEVYRKALSMIEEFFLDTAIARRMWFRKDKPVMVKFSSTQ
ncbi:importin subunit alpha-4-like protein [Aphelenchoides avenae]|nr:importin subunit alpha-4-like protein [Aphelenchus avenae]